MLRRLPRSFILVAYLLGAVGLIFAFLIIPHAEIVQPLHQVQDPAATSLDMIQQIATLVTTLNSAMLAAAGALLVRSFQQNARSAVNDILLLFVFLAGAVSYFGVYYSQTRLLTMVSTGYLDPLELGLLWGLRLQYGGILFGVFLLGLVFARVLAAFSPTGPSDQTLPGA